MKRKELMKMLALFGADDTEVHIEGWCETPKVSVFGPVRVITHSDEQGIVLSTLLPKGHSQHVPSENEIIASAAQGSEEVPLAGAGPGF